MSCFSPLIRTSPSRRGGERCRLCGSALHSARYRAQASRPPAGLGPEHDWRFSFCCARDGCRTRETPPSLRFLGRKVYLAAMVVLIATPAGGRDGSADATAVRSLSASTAARSSAGGEWWRDTFTASPFWQIGARRLHAARRSGSPAGLADRALYRQRGRAARCAAALPRARSPEDDSARSLTAFLTSAEDARRQQCQAPSTVACALIQGAPA